MKRYDTKDGVSNERCDLRIDRTDVPLGSASNGRGRIDDYTQQPRAEGYDEQARGAGEGKGHDGICAHRSTKAGTPLMQAAQTIGIDLPLKALVWQDGSGKTWLSYNDPGWLAKRHALGHEAEATVNAMTGALDAVAKAATTPP
jgi:hypothetical protein